MTGKCRGENHPTVHRDIPEEERGMLSGGRKGLINACQGGEVDAAKVRRGGVWSGAGTLAGRATAAPRQHRSRGAGPRSWACISYWPTTALQSPSLPTNGDAL